MTLFFWFQARGCVVQAVRETKPMSPMQNLNHHHFIQWCSEGRAWPGTCPPRAPCSCRSCHAISLISRKREANGPAYSRCPANTNDLATQLISLHVRIIILALVLLLPRFFVLVFLLFCISRPSHARTFVREVGVQTYIPPSTIVSRRPECMLLHSLDGSRW